MVWALGHTLGRMGALLEERLVSSAAARRRDVNNVAASSRVAALIG